MFFIITWFLACFSGYNPTLSEEKLNEEAIDTNLLDDPDLDLDGYSVLDGDCDDDNPEINPDAPELCDGIDNNCNDIVDEGISQLWYADADTDGYGDFTQPYFGCEQLEGYVTNDGDCNDAVPEINPEAIEECNGLDDNCDGTADEGIGTPLYADTDFDGFGDPEAMEYSCVPIDGFVSNSDDCDDTSIFINPDAFEICNEQDDNCDGFVDNDPTNAPYWYEDQDGDGFAGYDSVVVSCTQPEGFTLNAEDCDDQNTAVNPDSPEICDGIDNDCNNQIDDNATGSNTFYADNDGDGFGSANSSIEACSRPGGYSTDATDCNDNAGGINPNAQEICDG
ncbi:MAG: putative metal-binding motif-containing protein, partial [Myxococcota bacterium]|nr:putative metal-binding motif-containing protein [Myxococcota bacterium]